MSEKQSLTLSGENVHHTQQWMDLFPSSHLMQPPEQMLQWCLKYRVQHFIYTYFLLDESVLVLCQHFHCLISWVWHNTMLLNPEALFSILQQYANHSYFLLMFSIVSIILTDIFYEFSWTAFSHSNLYMLKLTHFRMWRQIQGLQIQIHWFLT